MIKTSIVPKEYIKDKESLADFECMLCYELATQVVRCRGPCQKSFCLKCLSRSKTKKDVCPSRCSKPFLTEPISDLKIEFVCPYSPLCTLPILTLD